MISIKIKWVYIGKTCTLSLCALHGCKLAPYCEKEFNSFHLLRLLCCRSKSSSVLSPEFFLLLCTAGIWSASAGPSMIFMENYPLCKCCLIILPTNMTPSLVFSAATATPSLVFSAATAMPSLALDKPFINTSILAELWERERAVSLQQKITRI